MRYDVDMQNVRGYSICNCWTRTIKHHTLKEADLSCNKFGQSLKTFLFGQWATAQCDLFYLHRLEITSLLTYLHLDVHVYFTCMLCVDVADSSNCQ